MDWTFKHFNQQAVFNAPRESVLETARAVVGESLQGIADTTDGFVARGYSGWHAATATFHITPTQDGTRLAVELVVKRAAIRSYMLIDVGGFYNGQIDKWFARIAQRLQGAPEHVIVSKSTADYRIRNGCVAGCLVYIIAGACLTVFAIPLDQALLPQSSASTLGPFTAVASTLGLLAGIVAFLYVRYPEGGVAKFIRERLHGGGNPENPGSR